MSHTLPRKARRVLSAISVAALTVTLSACGAQDKPSTSSPPTAAPSPPSAETEASSKALAAYNGYREAYIAAAATADSQGTELRKYIGDPLLGDTLYFLAQMKSNGVIRTGRPDSTPTVVSVNATTAPFTAQIQDCVDNTNWVTVHKDSGKPADAPGQVQRHRVNSEALRYDDGRWLIHKSSVDKGATC